MTGSSAETKDLTYTLWILFPSKLQPCGSSLQLAILVELHPSKIAIQDHLHLGIELSRGLSIHNCGQIWDSGQQPVTMTKRDLIAAQHQIAIGKLLCRTFLTTADLTKIILPIFLPHLNFLACELETRNCFHPAPVPAANSKRLAKGI